MEWFLYYAIGVSGEQFNQFVTNNKGKDLEFFRGELEYVLNSANIFNYYLIPARAAKKVVIGTQLKSRDKLKILFEFFLSSFKNFSEYGIRLNMPEPVSENLYFMSKQSGDYYRYINRKFNHKGTPSHAGDGFRLLGGERSEIEIKSTTSGGVRNTFSDKQIDSKKIIYFSINKDQLREYLKDEKTEITITIYEFGDGIIPILEERIKDKKSNSRPELPSVEQIEENKYEWLEKEPEQFVWKQGAFHKL